MLHFNKKIHKKYKRNNKLIEKAYFIKHLDIVCNNLLDWIKINVSNLVDKFDKNGKHDD